MKFNSQVLRKAFHAFCFLLPLHTALAQPSYIKEDRDGDGVPDVRDKCPDTDKNLNGQEFKVELDGKTYFVKIANVKKNFEESRRKYLMDNSRLEKEKKVLLDKAGGKTHMDKLTEEERQRIADIDTIETKNRLKLSNLHYIATVQHNGKATPVEIEIGVDDFGCLPDRDGDSVPDIVDKCPDDPGKPYYNGCNDRDGDGVFDHEDACPDEPGLKELKGCPDKGTGDKDKDGTIDKDDLCPTVPGPKSNKGCPELVTEEQKRIIEMASRVLFEFGSAELRFESLAILDQLAQVINDVTRKHGKIKVRLEGHTDDVGSNENNLELSRNRAKSVREYLITKGIDPFSLSSTGYGEEKPITENATPEGRQKNRRVEIAITNQ
ncbi:MAG: OmpA family protein [Bacteroidetes bacterium]|nr:MAG: OmpA family protein [Bacteroidota bacterium]